MAGATAEILLGEFSDDTLASWQRIVAARSVSQTGRDFWIPPREAQGAQASALPFFWNLSRADDDLWVFLDAPDAAASIRDAFGFTPTASISLGAMCRGRPSDRILAELVGSLLADCQGALLFDGLLCPSLDPSEWQLWSAMSPEAKAATLPTLLGACPGRLVVVRCDGEPAYHAVDLPFLRFWEDHPWFHFVN